MTHTVEPFVLTVLGPVPPEDIEIALSHEHLLIDTTCCWQEPVEASKKGVAYSPVGLRNLGEIRRDPLLCRDNCQLFDLELAVKEILKFKRAGGNTVVDLTNKGRGRDPSALAAISRETGLNIVMGCGYYSAASHPHDMEQRSLEQIADEIVREIEQGVDGTDIRPGIIGELGASSPITEQETKVLRAAARAHTATGAPINVHVFGWGREALKVLDILEAEGADVNCVVISHMSPSLKDVEYQKAIASRGAYLSYDFFGQDFYFDSLGLWVPKDTECITAIANLINLGFLDRILLSHDVHTKTQLTRYGGWGYAHLLTNLPRFFRKEGIDDHMLQVMMQNNPRRMLTFAKDNSSQRKET